MQFCSRALRLATSGNGVLRVYTGQQRNGHVTAIPSSSSSEIPFHRVISQDGNFQKPFTFESIRLRLEYENRYDDRAWLLIGRYRERWFPRTGSGFSREKVSGVKKYYTRYNTWILNLSFDENWRIKILFAIYYISLNFYITILSNDWNNLRKIVLFLGRIFPRIHPNYKSNLHVKTLFILNWMNWLK